MKRLLIVLFFTPLLSMGQSNLDSLWEVWSDKSQSDSLRLNAIYQFAWNGFLFTQPDSAYILYQQMYDFAKETGYRREMSSALTAQGISFAFRGNYEESIKRMMASLEIKEELGDERGKAKTLGNIGNIYADQDDYDKAATYFTKSLEINTKLNDRKGIGSCLHNLGVCYQKQGNSEASTKSYKQSLLIRQEIDDQEGMALTYNNIGNNYSDVNQFDSAYTYYVKALEIAEKLGYKKRISEITNNIGQNYFDIGNYAEAERYSERALTIAKEIEGLQEIKSAAASLYFLYKRTGNSVKALEMYELHVAARDTIAREDNLNELLNQEYKYKYEKEQAIADKAHELELQKQEEVAQIKQTRQYIVIGGIGIGLVLVIIFSISLFKRYKLTELQKLQIQEKNKEITDSITYAQRIQEAILPPASLMTSALPNSFVLYKPKDIVAGDFYWLEPKGDNVLFAAADCTGHGVPGAMVSVVCHNALNRSVREFGLTDPGQILDKCKELVIDTFERSNQNVQDGMDIALCNLNTITGELKFAGAHNGLLIIREGTQTIEELELTRGDKQPVGMYTSEQPFTTKTVQLSKGDSLYILTDGYQDQFGGPKGKKFMFKRLKNLLFENHTKSLEEQRTALERSFEEWKSGIEQIDDVCVIGVRY